MNKYRLCIFVTIILVVLAIHHPVKASTFKPLDKPGVEEFLKNAYEVQYSLTERHHSWEEASTKLGDYMTNEFSTKFMEEHLFHEEEGYIFYGTDFSIYIVPRYSYNDKTKIVVNPTLKTMYVYEKFNGTGPVVFDSQFETITLKLVGSKWKIANISFETELPDEVKQAITLEEFELESTWDNSVTTKYESQINSNIERGNLDIQQKLITHLNEREAISSVSSSIVNESSEYMTRNPFQSFIGVIPYGLLFQDTQVNQERSIHTLLSIHWR
jgi:ribosomal protein L21E